MGQRERDAHRWMRDNMLRPGDRMTRVENKVHDGTPDTNLCIAGVEAWIEIKAPREKVNPGLVLFKGQHSFSVDQKNFALAQRKAGGTIWAFIATDQRKLLVPGRFIERINEMTFTEVRESAVWEHFKGESLVLSCDALRHALVDRLGNT